MHALVKMTVAAALIGVSAVASAGTYDFSYLFGDGQEVTGSFTGTSTDGGQSVTNISNLQVQLNGIAFGPVTSNGITTGNATLQVNAWNPTLVAFDDTTPVTIYANGALNNFSISDVDAAVNVPDYEFVYLNDATNGFYEVVANNYLQSDSFSPGSTQLATDEPGNAADWTLTPVPLPAPVLLLASSLGLLGVIGRRRRAA